MRSLAQRNKGATSAPVSVHVAECSSVGTGFFGQARRRGGKKVKRGAQPRLVVATSNRSGGPWLPVRHCRAAAWPAAPPRQTAARRPGQPGLQPRQGPARPVPRAPAPPACCTEGAAAARARCRRGCAPGCRRGCPGSPFGTCGPPVRESGVCLCGSVCSPAAGQPGGRAACPASVHTYENGGPCAVPCLTAPNAPGSRS